MPVYLIANVEKVTDESWIPDYAANVHHIVHRHGGKYLSRSANIATVEGEDPGLALIALLEFPSREAVQAFMDDPEYAPYAAARKAGTEGYFVVIDDVDVTGAIPYLSKN